MALIWLMDCILAASPLSIYRGRNGCRRCPSRQHTVGRGAGSTRTRPGGRRL